ncbi:hypothetical protein FRC01_001295, partial [Tulasnella sp. 417]
YRAADREAAVWRAVPRHPHILHFLGECKVTRQWYYAVPYYSSLSPMLVYLHSHPWEDRGALVRDSHISVGGSTPSGNIVRQVLQVCDALKALHSSNIVHGHVGITHLLVSNQGALLYDFCRSRTQDQGFEEDVFDLGIAMVEILRGKEYNHKLFRLRQRYPNRPPWNSRERIAYGAIWDIASWCWSPNPSSRPTVPEIFESLSGSLGRVRVTEPLASGSNAALGDSLPLEAFRGSSRTTPHYEPQEPPPQSRTQLSTSNQLVLPQISPPASTPEPLTPARESTGQWIECATFFNLPVERYRRIYEREQAVGGYSDVFKCETTYSDGSRQLVAEKVLRAARIYETEMVFLQCLQKLTKEVAVWKNLHHPCIAPLMGFTVHPSIALISPWYENGNVEEYILSLQRRKQDCDRLKLLDEIARGLTYLHEFTPPVVHGDIKTDNILVDSGGSALIIDFGLSRALLETVPGSISSDRGAGNILTGETPFSHFTNQTILMLARLSETPPSPASTRPEMICTSALEKPLWKLLDECWTPNPAERPTMRKIEERIQKLRRLDAAVAEAQPVQDLCSPTNSDGKGEKVKEKKERDQPDNQPEILNQPPDEKPPLGEPPSSKPPLLAAPERLRHRDWSRLVRLMRLARRSGPRSDDP